MQEDETDQRSPAERNVDLMQDGIQDLQSDVSNGADACMKQLKLMQAEFNTDSPAHRKIQEICQIHLKRLQADGQIGRAEGSLVAVNNSISTLKTNPENTAQLLTKEVAALNEIRDQIFEQPGSYKTISQELQGDVNDPTITSDSEAAAALRKLSQLVTDTSGDLRGNWTSFENDFTVRVGNLLKVTK